MLKRKRGRQFLPMSSGPSLPTPVPTPAVCSFQICLVLVCMPGHEVSRTAFLIMALLCVQKEQGCPPGGGQTWDLEGFLERGCNWSRRGVSREGRKGAFLKEGSNSQGVSCLSLSP